MTQTPNVKPTLVALAWLVSKHMKQANGSMLATEEHDEGIDRRVGGKPTPGQSYYSSDDADATPAPAVVPADEDGTPLDVRLGNHSCKFVTNIPLSSDGNDASNPRTYFDLGLRHFFAYQHEDAYKCFLAVAALAPDCAFAHGMVALSHCPNYNFKGDAYYESTNHPEEEEEILEAGNTGQNIAILRRLYPSQQVAATHSLLAIEKVEELKKECDKTDSSSRMVSDIEAQILSAIRTLTCHPGIHPHRAEETVGRPYADALRKVHKRHPNDAEVACFFAESLMVLNAWSLYEYKTGRPLSQDVEEIKFVLESALKVHPRHAGLCHLYVHLCEMSNHPQKALSACEALRSDFPDAGHLIHMPTHIDVLLGDYETVVEHNLSAICADKKVMRISPDTAGTDSFYFGYIVHNFHMAAYGAILGGMEAIGMKTANELNGYVNENLFIENQDLAAYLESYSALDVHIMVRFGRWEEILQLPFPQYPLLMLYRSASLHYARGLALANTGDVNTAIDEANLLDELRSNSSAELRILHNNNVSDLLAVDATMLRGEIAYFSGEYDEAFTLLRSAVAQQDGLNFDEPWGKMMPIRHSLGGLLCKQGHYDEADTIFREDLSRHPRNPWGLVGLIGCLNKRLNTEKAKCCSKGKQIKGEISEEEQKRVQLEVEDLTALLAEQRKSKWADYQITAPCACCAQT